MYNNDFNNEFFSLYYTQQISEQDGRFVVGLNFVLSQSIAVIAGWLDEFRFRARIGFRVKVLVTERLNE